MDIAKPDTSIDPRVLDSARKEFLEKGFQDASLKEICRKAGVTTGALYNRYSGKGELFDAIVSPLLAEFKAIEEDACHRNWALLNNEELKQMWSMSEEFHTKWVDFFYSRHIEMRLLLCCSEGTKHSNFTHDFAEQNTKLTMLFVEEAKKRELPVNDIDANHLHIFMTAYWTALFEPIVHGYSKKKALDFVAKAAEFFDWESIFGF